jgi:hypothetical protein
LILGYKVWILGYKVLILGYKVLILGYKVLILGYKADGQCCTFKNFSPPVCRQAGEGHEVIH